MKPKQDNDRQSIADLLKKLQSSYLGGGQKAEKKAKQETDRSDADFQEKLASMLGKVTAPSEKVSKAKPKADKKAAEPKPHAPATPPSAEDAGTAPVEERLTESLSPTEIEPETAAPRAPAEPTKKPKRKSATTKKKSPPRSADNPSEEHRDAPEELVPSPQVQPEVIIEEPEAAADEPEVIVEEPEIAADEPEAIVEEPEAAADEPEVIAEEPEVVVEEPEKAEQAEKEPAPIRIPSPAPKIPSIRPVPPPASPTERVHVIKPSPQPKAQAKSKPAAPRDAIVIRPPADRIAASADAIVIRPRAEKPQRPTPRVVQASVSAPPIKIGKEVPSGTWEIPSPDPEITVKPNMNHEEITAASPSVAPSDAASPSGEVEKTVQASKTAANIKKTVVRERVSLPQSAQPASAQKTPAHRHTVQSPSPVEDDVLEEVLESANESELMIEELPFGKLSHGFVAACARLLALLREARFPLRCNYPLLAFRMKDGAHRLMIFNPYDNGYCTAVVTFPEPIQKAQIRSRYPVLPPRFLQEGEPGVYYDFDAEPSTKNRFEVKLAPDGVTVADLWL